MRNPWNAVIAEGAGTFLFFFVGIGSVAMSDWAARAAGQPPGLIVIALAHGLVLAVLVSALAAVSGAHFNPAVTFGVWVAGQIPSRRAVSYVLAQLIGGIAAAWSLRSIFPADVSPGLGTPQLGTGIGVGPGIAIEAILTVVLLVAVFGTAIDPRGPKVGSLAIGFAVAADIMMGGPLTGAAMNPARWLGPAATTGIWTDGHVWVIGPLLGAAIAAIVYRFFLLPEAAAARTPATPEPESAV
ncbi:MAG TPA: aquaporin [Candidatus Caenarcaniphilales bacterium]|nr:aquaporin [Candidatus Caenarcaniphilales bacterium]